MILAMLRDRAAWLHSSKTFLAAVLAMIIALCADLPRPYWAMATAYLVMQPVLGGTHARGIYRIVGTLLGAGAALIMVPTLAQAPVVLAFGMSLWLAACLFVTMLHRGPDSYTFMLAGYTAAFVGFPMVDQPEGLFDIALARSEEIVLGSLCAVVVGAVVFPVSIKPMIVRSVGGLMRDARSWCAEVLQRRDGPGELRRRLAADLSTLDRMIIFARRDDPRHGRLSEWLEELRARLLGMLPVVASVESRLHDLGEAAAADAGLTQLLADLGAWIDREAAPQPQTLERLHRQIAGLRPVLDGTPASLLRDSLLLRLKELTDLWYDCRHLQQSLLTGTAPPAPAFGLDLAGLVKFTNRHIDWSRLAFSSLAAGATLFVYCLLWIGTGWTAGAGGALMVALFASFFVAYDDPAPGMMVFLGWGLFTTVLVGVYLFGVFPAIHNLVPLVLVITPPFLLFGLMALRPEFFLASLILIGYFPTQLGIQDHYAADFAAYVNSSLSAILGMLFTVVITRLFRTFGAEWSARRLIRQGWQLLAQCAQGHGRQDRDRFMVRMLDLLGLLAPRMALLAGSGSDVTSVDMLGEVRIGLNILNLRRVRNDLPEINRASVNRLLEGVALHYEALERAGRPQPPPEALRAALEGSLARVRTLAAGEARDEALLGLVGLRHAMFPGQPMTEALPGSGTPADSAAA